MIKLKHMDKKEIVNYLDQFMDYSSYLIWGENAGDISPILNKDNLLNKFNPKYVFAALNQCGHTEKYTNFHNPHSGGDTKLMNTIRMRPEFEWCFITDVFAGDKFETKNGDELKKLFSKNPTLKDEGINEFINRIKPLLDDGAVIVALGKDCFDYLYQYKKLRNKVFLIPHFSSSKSYEERCSALISILRGKSNANV